MKLEKSLVETFEESYASQNRDRTTNKYLNIIIVSVCILIISILISISLILYFIHKDDTIENPYFKIRLENWEFGSTKKIILTGENISLGIESDNFIKAPNDFYVCTPMGGLSGHTNNFFNEKELQNVDKTQFDSDWWFRSNFSLQNIDNDTNLILLYINGINYKSDIYLDGKLVESQKKIIGTFVTFTLDITNFLNKNLDVHYIAFKISKPNNQLLGDKSLSNRNDLATFANSNPEPPDGNMGIWQPVNIEFIPHKISTISSVLINTKLIDEKYSNLEIVFYVKNWENKIIYNNISINIGDFINLPLENINLEPNEERKITINNNPQLKIDNSKLWWPYQMGEPKLHNLTIKIINKDNNYYIYSKKIGLRHISSELDEKRNRFYKINNKKILLKGGVWSPDIFLRQSPEKYLDHIKYVKDMELNVIRLEGNSEGEEFYNYCDEFGILIISGWNSDFWKRWEDWSDDDKKIADNSLISQIRKLSIHPSAIIFILGSDLAPTNQIEEKWREIFKEEKWPNEILSSAANYEGNNYSTGVKMTGPYSWVPPNYFYLEKSRNIDNGGAWGFLTKGSPGENPLRKGSFEKIFNSDDFNSDSWKYHCGKEGSSFANLDKFIKPINERYGKILNFDDFQNKSSAAVYEGHRAMFEAYSCYKYDSTGIIHWMLNNAWPSNIWHLYDYFFAPTPAYFAVKKSGERIHVLYNYEDSYIYLLNNYFSDFNDNFILNVYIISGLNGNDLLYNKSYNYKNIKGDEIIKIDKINTDYDNIFILHFEYSYNYNGETYFYTNTYWLNKEMDEIDFQNKTLYNVGISKYTNFTSLQYLPQTNLSVEIIEKKLVSENNKKKYKYKFKILNEGKTIGLLLEMKLYEINKITNKNELITPIFWNDNYFSIRSGTSYNVIAEFYYNNSNDILLEIIGWNNIVYTKIITK